MLQILLLFLYGNCIVATHEIRGIIWWLLICWRYTFKTQTFHLIATRAHRKHLCGGLLTAFLKEIHILLLPTVLIGEEVPLNKKLGSCRDHYGIKNAKLWGGRSIRASLWYCQLSCKYVASGVLCKFCWIWARCEL